MSDFRMEGTYPIVPTPLTADEEVDEEGLRRVINYEIDGGVDGLWMLGTRGEGPNLGPSMHQRILEVTMDEVNGRVPVVTGCGVPGTKQTIENVRLAESCGADVVHITEPYYYKLDGKPYGDRELVAHYEAVAEAAQVPVVIYFHDTKWPTLVAGQCPEPIKKLAAHPNIVGVKVSSGDQRILQSMVWDTEEITDNFSVMITFGHMAFAGLLVGCHGTTAPESAFAPKLFVEMYIAIREGDLTKALELQKKSLPLANALRGYDAPSGKVALAAIGLCEEYMSMPMQPMPEPARQNLIDLMKSGEYR